jgi:hypothetical protein
MNDWYSGMLMIASISRPRWLSTGITAAFAKPSPPGPKP